MKKNLFKKGLAFALALAALTAMAGCGSEDAATTASTNGNASAESDLSYITGKNEMVIGYTLFAPMNYMENGELIGFETEFATAVCEKLGVAPKFQEINWDSKEVELNSKAIDCIWNGMTITENIKENLSVTMPYMENRQVMIVKAGDEEKYAESVDGAKIVAESGSAGEELVTGDEMFANAEFIPVDSQAKGLMDVASGVSDIVVLDYIMALGSVGEGTDFEDLVIIDKGFPSEDYGVAFRKGSDVTEKVNAAMKELKADGTLDEIAAKYNLSDLLSVE